MKIPTPCRHCREMTTNGTYCSNACWMAEADAQARKPSPAVPERAETPHFAAGVMTWLKEECERQHQRAEAAEASLATVTAELTEARAQWRCFHCDETFTTEEDARDHFGSSEYRTPACRLAAEDVKRLRELEQANIDLQHENERLDNDARLWHESEAERKRLIGDHAWWFHLDCLEGERLVLKQELTEARAARERVEQALTKIIENCEVWQSDDWDERQTLGFITGIEHMARAALTPTPPQAQETERQP